MTLISRIASGAAWTAKTCLGAALGLGLVLSAAPDVALAQDTSAPAITENTASHPALWVVRDADSTIYLFGTIHLMRPGHDWMTPQIAEAFNSAQTLWLEIEDPADQSAVAPLIMQYGLSPAEPLSSRLTPEEFAELDRIGQTVGMSGAMMDPMRPWLAGLSLSMAPLMQAGYDPSAGVDVLLRADAVESGKPIRGLESAEQQIRFFADMSPEDELTFLRSTIETFDTSTAELDQMAAAWSAGDPEAIYALGGAEMKAEYPSIYALILTNRNADWVNQIQTELAGSGTVFMAVGALHLAGPDSVVAQLEAQGVSVARVQ